MANQFSSKGSGFLEFIDIKRKFEHLSMIRKKRQTPHYWCYQVDRTVTKRSWRREREAAKELVSVIYLSRKKAISFVRKRLTYLYDYRCSSLSDGTIAIKSGHRRILYVPRIWHLLIHRSCPFLIVETTFLYSHTPVSLSEMKKSASRQLSSIVNDQFLLARMRKRIVFRPMRPHSYSI